VQQFIAENATNPISLIALAGFPDYQTSIGDGDHIKAPADSG
jgi:hypothetical protein